MKKYILRGGIVGFLLGLIPFLYLLSKGHCDGLYGGGTCYKFDFLINSLKDIYSPNFNHDIFILLFVFVVIGIFVGYIWGKLKNRKN